MKPTLILDFDGALTDVAQESIPYIERFRALFATRQGIQEYELSDVIARMTARVDADPTLGWVNDSVIVAPATADPYIRNTVIFQQVCSELGILSATSQKLLQEVHGVAYQHSTVAFRPYAKEFLQQVTQDYNTTVITNASTTAVEKKLAILGVRGIPVHGGAGKFIVDQTWTKVPESVIPPGFPRPVMLRRQLYANALASAGALPQNTIVMGDIYEVDLALPEYLGMDIIQICHDSTPNHEARYMSSHPRRAACASLEHALEKIGEFSLNDHQP